MFESLLFYLICCFCVNRLNKRSVILYNKNAHFGSLPSQCRVPTSHHHNWRFNHRITTLNHHLKGQKILPAAILCWCSKSKQGFLLIFPQTFVFQSSSFSLSFSFLFTSFCHFTSFCLEKRERLITKDKGGQREGTSEIPEIIEEKKAPT